MKTRLQIILALSTGARLSSLNSGNLSGDYLVAPWTGFGTGTSSSTPFDQKTQFADKQMIFEPAGFSSDTSFIVYMGNRWVKLRDFTRTTPWHLTF
jgi:hypothetical protein